MIPDEGARLRARSGRRGFALIELLVVVGIVVFLAGLTITGAAALIERSEIERTHRTMDLIDLALSEWQTETGRHLTWGPEPGEHDIWSYRSHELIITELIQTIRRHAAARDVLARVDRGAIYVYTEGETPPWIAGYATVQMRDFYGEWAVLDAWGIPIYATHPGALAAPGDTPDADGTERTANELEYGTARDRRVCFVSAGPDRRFGILREFLTLPPAERAAAMEEARADNLYSYEVVVGP